MTGTAGALLRESVDVALTRMRANAESLVGIAELDASTDVHVRLAEAGCWKDGPSAGITPAGALVAALTGRPARRDVAKTGELTLSGRVARLRSSWSHRSRRRTARSGPAGPRGKQRDDARAHGEGSSLPRPIP